MSNKQTNIDYLDPKNMILLYARGAFPMAEKNGRINWYMPEIRTIIPLDSFNIPRSLSKFMKKTNFKFSYDQSTMDVVKNCSSRNETWINDRLIKAYEGIMQLGHLHSVEVYEKQNLVGGLYGVTFRGAFFGESMFSKKSQASKAALVKLIERLHAKGFKVLDVQYYTDHLGMFGAREIPFEEYAALLKQAYQWEISFN
ncbi:MAG: leucyl/phenylalanyl-tRNA--protein transferase [Ignavibacteriales bacterium]|jgi:leucyl/phenylalanyl-tRNA--protein transferase|nr:MAG: leucyl/phenylalanyl-tRNA--protein transferase [Ignavibacteriales bacterium]